MINDSITQTYSLLTDLVDLNMNHIHIYVTLKQVTTVSYKTCKKFISSLFCCIRLRYFCYFSGLKAYGNILVCTSLSLDRICHSSRGNIQDMKFSDLYEEKTRATLKVTSKTRGIRQRFFWNFFFLFRNRIWEPWISSALR